MWAVHLQIWIYISVSVDIYRPFLHAVTVLHVWQYLQNIFFFQYSLITQQYIIHSCNITFDIW